MQITKDKLNIAVIGGGGREHAIIGRLAQSRRAGKIYALPGNGGISREHAGSDSCPVTCTGIAATDLEKIVDFVLNNELKTLTVRIPYAVLSPINIPADQIKFRDVVKGWAAPKDIKLTAEENAQLTIQVNDKMKAKLIDENVIAVANENAKTVVADLLSVTVQSIDPEFTVVVVQ